MSDPTHLAPFALGPSAPGMRCGREGCPRMLPALGQVLGAQCVQPCQGWGDVWLCQLVMLGCDLLQRRSLWSLSHLDSVGRILTGIASGCPQDMVFQQDEIFQPFPHAHSSCLSWQQSPDLLTEMHIPFQGPNSGLTSICGGIAGASKTPVGTWRITLPSSSPSW